MDRLIPVTFRFPVALAGEAKRVSLLGPFNNWTPNMHALTRTGDFWWTITMSFPPGRVVYCFDVDGTTWLDPSDHGRTPNGRGSDFQIYSIRNVPPAPEPPSTVGPQKDVIPIQGGAPLFECGVEEAPEATILRPFGEIDLDTASLFREALTQSVAKEHSVIVDMSGVQYIDSIGIHALGEHAKYCKQHGDLLVLVAPRRPVQKVIRITHLDDAIPVLGSVEVALDLLRSRAKLPPQLVPNEPQPTVARRGRIPSTAEG
jgi:anti-sigma B factor antagonist